MNSNVLPSDRVAIAGNIDPDAYAAGTYTTGWVSMAKFLAIMAIVQAGTLGASATLDAKLEQATDGSGTGVKDIAGKAITQLTKAGSDDDKQAVINLFADELDINNGFTHARLSITVGTATSDAGGIVLGLDPRSDVASASDAASVDEIV
jgi:hypothetical protein